MSFSLASIVRNENQSSTQHRAAQAALHHWRIDTIYTFGGTNFPLSTAPSCTEASRVASRSQLPPFPSLPLYFLQFPSSHLPLEVGMLISRGSGGAL